MAVTRTLANSALARIATQISAAMPGAAFLGGPTGAAPGVSSEVGESVDVFVLGAADVSPAAKLSEIAEPLDCFFHLVYQNDQPAGYARSDLALGGGDGPKVTEVSDDPGLALLVRQALRSLDGEFPADHWLVSMLMAPAFHVVALWIRGKDGSRVCVLQSDASDLPVNNLAVTNGGGLTRDELDFMTRLSSSKQVQGLAP